MHPTEEEVSEQEPDYLPMASLPSIPLNPSPPLAVPDLDSTLLAVADSSDQAAGQCSETAGNMLTFPLPRLLSVPEKK